MTEATTMIFEVNVPQGRRASDAKVGKVLWVQAQHTHEVLKALDGTRASFSWVSSGECFPDRVDYTLPADADLLRRHLFR